MKLTTNSRLDLGTDFYGNKLINLIELMNIHHTHASMQTCNGAFKYYYSATFKRILLHHKVDAKKISEGQ